MGMLKVKEWLWQQHVKDLVRLGYQNVQSPIKSIGSKFLVALVKSGP